MTLKKLSALILISAIFMVTSCKKDDASEPVQDLNAYFDINSKDFSQDPFVYPPDASIFLDNKSTEGVEYAWDFGDGQKSTAKTPTISYGDIGTYKINLNVSKHEQKKSLEKIAVIRDRKAYEMQVMVRKWNTRFYQDIDWPDDKKADVFVRIYRIPKGSIAKLAGGTFIEELYYESAVLKDVTPGTAPLFIPLTKDLYIQSPLNKWQLGYCLYAVSEGKEHLLFSNWGSAVAINFTEDYTTRISKLETGFEGAQITIKAGY
jgi:hypothetical protein